MHTKAKRSASSLLSVLLCLISCPGVLSAQEAPRAVRVHILPIRPVADDPTVRAATAATADTIALTLGLLGGYEVTEVPLGSFDTSDEYLDERGIEAMDRLLFVETSRETGAYFVSAGVVDPLSREQLLVRRGTAEGALDLFSVSDRLVSELLGELSGQRITFGEITFEPGSWIPGSYHEVAWEKIAVATSSDLSSLVDFTDEVVDRDVAPLPDTRNDMVFRVGGVDLDLTDADSQRVLTGVREAQLFQQRAGRLQPIYEETVEIREEQETVVSYNIPILTESDAEELNRLIAGVVTAQSQAETDGSETSIAAWIAAIGNVKEYCEKLSSSVPHFTDILWRFDLLTAAAEAKGVEYIAATNWREPDYRWFDRLSNMSKYRVSLPRLGVVPAPSATNQDEIMETITAEVADRIAPLFALEAVRPLAEEDWQSLDRRYSRIREAKETAGLPQPSWLVHDLSFIEESLDTYRRERRERPGLYRALSWSGAVLFFAGAATWSVGLARARNNAASLEEYRDTTDPNRTTDLRARIESNRDTANLLQGAGIGAAATGVATFVSGVLVQRRDRTRPDRRLIERLSTYFRPYTAIRDDLEAQDSRTLQLPIDGFGDD